VSVLVERDKDLLRQLAVATMVRSHRIAVIESQNGSLMPPTGAIRTSVRITARVCACLRIQHFTPADPMRLVFYSLLVWICLLVVNEPAFIYYFYPKIIPRAENRWIGNYIKAQSYIYDPQMRRS
jgi:hypothetical protein